MAKLPEKSKLPPDFGLLNPDKRAELKQRAERAVEAEHAKVAEDAYYERLLAEARRARIPAERMETLTVEMAPFSDKVTIDGVPYWHGQTVTVPASAAAVLREQSYRSWGHQNQVDGRNTQEAYRRQRNTVLSATRGVL